MFLFFFPLLSFSPPPFSSFFRWRIDHDYCTKIICVILLAESILVNVIIIIIRPVSMMLFIAFLETVSDISLDTVHLEFIKRIVDKI